MQLRTRTTPDLIHLAQVAVETKDAGLAMSVSDVLAERSRYTMDTIYTEMFSGECLIHNVLYVGSNVAHCPFCGDDLVPF